MRWISSVITALCTLFVFVAPAKASPIKKCPEGGRLRGQPPPQGKRQWCVADDLFGRARKNGPVRIWHDNGQLRIQGEYVDDQRNGVWKFYSKDGRLAMEKFYRFGELDRTKKHQVSAGRARRPRESSAEQSIRRPPPPTSGRAPSTAEREPPTGERKPPAAERAPPSFDDGGSTSWVDEDARTTDDSFSARITTDVSIYSGNGLGIYRPAFEAVFSISNFNLEAQWGLGILTFASESNVEPLNPAFFITYDIEHSSGSIRTGAGVSIPVQSIDGTEDSIEGLATVVASGLPTGFWDFWLYIPEFPVVALTAVADFNLPFLLIDAELTPFLPIPTTSGASTDLGLQFAVDLAYPILDSLDAGARLQTVVIAIPSDVQAILNVEPFVRGRLGPAFARLGFEINAVRPETLQVGGLDGFLWSFNLGLGVEI